uniref:C2 domain-containing protein n=1 Tax=Elaeophora elaphi TaxID=1147741 RepID=A0A0R3RPS5_9BILA
MSDEEDDYDENEKIRDSEKERKKKKGRGQMLSKLRNIGRLMKSRIWREQSLSSQSTEYDLERGEDSRSDSIKSERAESEFTETPMQTNDTFSSDRDLDSERSHSRDDSPDNITSRRHGTVGGDKVNQEMIEAENEREDENLDMLQSFTVRLHIFEARELHGNSLNPLLRVILDGRCRSSLSQHNTNSPHWDESLTFTIRKSLQDMMQTCLEFRVYDARQLASDTLIGGFQCELGYIYKSKRHLLREKWLILRADYQEVVAMAESEQIASSDIRGFLKVSMNVRRSLDPTPTPSLRSTVTHDDEDILFSGSLMQYTMLVGQAVENYRNVRIFQLCQIADHLRMQNDEIARLAVQVQVGREHEMTRALPALYEVIDFNEEIMLPVVWPTIVKYVSFRIIFVYQTKIRKKNKEKILATAYLNLSDICQSGYMNEIAIDPSSSDNQGFLPVFGPSYISFYASSEHRITKKIEKAIREGRRPGDCFVARALIEVICLEEDCGRSCRDSITPDTVLSLKPQLRTSEYVLLSTFFAVNMIHPKLKSKNVRFSLSIGEYGNRAYGKVMPAFAEKYYTMPWGNHKPVCEIPCAWEDAAFRMRHSNVLQKIAKVLLHSSGLAKLKSDGKTEVSSIIVDAIDQACDYFAKLSKCIERDWESPLSSSLDRQRRHVIASTIIKMIEDFATLKYDKKNVFQVNEIALNQLQRSAELLMKISHEPEMSIPDAVLSMCNGDELLAFARIPVNEIYYDTKDCYRGILCGRLRAITLKWPSHDEKREKKEQIPAVVHLRLWFGKITDRNHWDKAIKPGVVQYFAEVFENQRRHIGGQWVETDGKNGEPYARSDETGIIRMSENDVKLSHGWSYKGAWKIMFCHDMWVGPDAGHSQYEDEIFEVQEKQDDIWTALYYTGTSGNPIDHARDRSAPPGWRWVSDWTIDLFCAGDAEGWSYSSSVANFANDDAVIDYRERFGDFTFGTLEGHKFRRRRWWRMRTLGTGTKDVFENIDALRRSIDPELWEYASDFREPVHVQKMPDDKYRRRRYVREMVFSANLSQRRRLALYLAEDISVSPRIYEVYDRVTRWQMRASILWARDLLPTNRRGSRAFVRVVFLNRCQETAIIENTVDPVIICGGITSVRNDSPAIVVEVCSKDFNSSETFLGRFMTTPSVISLATDHRGTPTWFPLSFRKDKKKGALLALFELFLYEGQAIHIAPLKPPRKKHSARYAVAQSVRPVVKQYTVQILCWGVRDLPRYQLSSVRNPFVEIRIGNKIARSDVIEDAKRNPNFKRPLIILNEVQLPVHLYYAPPLTFNLYDRRSFGREPHIGICVVQDFAKYISKLPKRTKRDSYSWQKYDEILASEEVYEKKMIMADSNGYFFDDCTIDWWSKYYSSIGESEKAPGYADSGIEKLRVFTCALEDVSEYCGFSDFLDTFTFRKMIKENIETPELRIPRGELKARIFIRREDKMSNEYFALPSVEFAGVTKCTVRVYIVRAFDLVSRRKDGTCDAYISVKCGTKKKKNLRKDYRPNSLNPLFGQMIEMEVEIPMDKNLVVSVMDRHRIFSDNEIGHTVIDLENRLLTQFRATVGLPQKYTIRGPLVWRDQLTPLSILKRHCMKMNYPTPEVLTKGDDVGIVMAGVAVWLSDIENLPPTHGEILGRPLQRIALYILTKMNLVPEHVETRPLYSAINMDSECGKLEMFVDLFPHVVGSVPPPLNISPRRPHKFQLRVAVWSVRNVILAKRTMGKPAADIYLKVFLNGSGKEEKTDVHYRSLDGYGSFNWRFVFDFDFDIWEKKLAMYTRKHFFGKKSLSLVNPILFVQIWDNNKFRKDGYIGQLALDLLSFDEAQMDADEMYNVDYTSERRNRCDCCMKCCSSLCGIKKHEQKKKIPLPRAPPYISGRVGQFSLFQQRTAYGWWPCVSTSLPDEQKLDFDARRKKDDDFTARKSYVTGAVELELTLLTAKEAKLDPVGRKRGKPNHSPYLPQPNRPRLDQFWCLSRAKACCSLCWTNWGKQCIIITIIVLIGVVLIVSTVYRLPDIITAKVFNTGS